MYLRGTKHCLELDSLHTERLSFQQDTTYILNLKMDYLGYVYEDPAVSQAVLKQKPFVIVDPKCKAAICVKHIVSRLEKVEYREGGGISNFLKKLVGRME